MSVSPPTGPRPLIGITCCRRILNEFPFHVVGDKYVRAILEPAAALPMLIPALGAQLSPEDVIARLDGLLLTGSPSNVEPWHYDGPPPPADNLADPARDATTLPLIRAAITAGLPVLGICRGLQEMNVALGGSLFQEVHAQPNRFDHRSGDEGSIPWRYRPIHDIALTPHGLFADLAGSEHAMVNSLHGQGIDRLAEGLAIEAVAPDGQIEAIRLEASNFCVAVQWHPEYEAHANPLSVALFAAFGEACRKFARSRRSG